jgi:hypothetical protein
MILQFDMTRTRTYILTAVSELLFLFLIWAFADDLFNMDNLFSGHYYAGYTIITCLMLAAIIAGGIVQARRLPAAGIDIRPDKDTTRWRQPDFHGHPAQRRAAPRQEHPPSVDRRDLPPVHQRLAASTSQHEQQTGAEQRNDALREVAGIVVHGYRHKTRQQFQHGRQEP